LSNNKIQNQKCFEYDKFLLYFVENKIQIKIVRIGLYLEKIHDLIIFIVLPDKFYKDKGWISWIDFFSKINIIYNPIYFTYLH
jgi:hypothetical protein